MAVSTPPALRVVIAGGGFAALEAALALRALADEQVHVTVVAPEPRFAYRPAATVEAFGEGPARSYDLAAMCREFGAVYRRDRLVGVVSRVRLARLGSGSRLAYDALVLALGARARTAVAGALTFRDQRDVPAFRRMLHELEHLRDARLVFAVSPGTTWPLPLYELALLAAGHAADHRLDTTIALVSPERTPLAVFGDEASRLVGGLLAERGVRFIGGAGASGVRRDGALVLQSGEVIEADRVVASPQLQAGRLLGVPSSRGGFVPTDSCGRVEGLVDVYAAGDMTTSPIKQGGLAAQQADRVAATIVAELDLPARSSRSDGVLGARLLGGEQPLFLCVELDALGHPATATLLHSDTDPAATSVKVLGRYLTPYLEARERVSSDRCPA
jgi:sulfide:quinone oxidoreductase